MQSQAINKAQNELEKLRALQYYDRELDALGSPEGMITMKTEDNFLIKIAVKYINPKTGAVPEKYPSDISEDTGLKEIAVSVKRKDNVGFQANLVTYFSKAKATRG